MICHSLRLHDLSMSLIPQASSLGNVGSRPRSSFLSRRVAPATQAVYAFKNRHTESRQQILTLLERFTDDPLNEVWLLSGLPVNGVLD